jgi:asparagine synthetase B (glutamine-hydrolysing)
MCGIFGLINGTKNRGASASICRAISDGIMLNSIRGADSTGLMQRDKKTTYAHRMVANGVDFAKHSSTYNYINDSDSAHFTVVHNRAATEGSVTLDNCHPFEAVTADGDNYVIGVHNGTLTNWKTPGSAYSVDSDWAISRLSEAGNDAFKEFTGAWAFVWQDDRNPEVLSICRNSSRPMFIAYIKHQDRMLFASEYQLLTWIAERNNLLLEDDIISLAPGKIYQFDIKNPRNFAKIDMPVRVYNSVDYQEREREKFVAGLKSILFPAKKPAVQSSVKPETTALVPTSQYLSNDEIRIAKVAEVMDSEIKFEPTLYDQQTRELWGACTLDGIIYTCLMRHVTAAMYNDFEKRAFVTCKVIGASASAGDDSTPKELTLILRRTWTEAPKAKDEDLDTNKAGETMAEVIAENIAKFQKEKEEANDSPTLALL